MSTHITGKLITVGDYTEEEQVDRDSPLARAVVVMPREALKAVRSLPMYEEVLIVKAEEWDQLERENAALRKQLTTESSTSTQEPEVEFRQSAVDDFNRVAAALSGEPEIERLKAENSALRAVLDRLSYLAHDRRQTRVTLRNAIDAARKGAQP